jgi:protein O-mannosyl-transferase
MMFSTPSSEGFVLENKKRQIWFSAAGLALVGFALFFPTLRHDFVYDDKWMITRNPSIQSLQSPQKFFVDPQTVGAPESGLHKDIYRPLATLTFALNAKVTGLKPGPFHAVNILLHVANALLFQALLLRWFTPMGALAGALLFLVHPLQVESVAWAAQRSILLCTFFVLACLVFRRKFEKEIPRTIFTALLFLAALFSKETTFALPILLFLEGKISKQNERFSVGVTTAVAAGFFAARGAILGQVGQSVAVQTSPAQSLLEGVSALSHYARTLFWPNNLNVSYGWPDSITLFSGRAIAGVVILALLFVAAIYCWRRRPLVSWGIAWFLLFWLPHAGIFPLVTYAADRFMYLPLAGLGVLFAGGVDRINKKAGALIIPLLLILCSAQRIKDWRNDETLWASSIRENPSNAFAQACLAQTYRFKGESDLAEKHYEAALQNQPSKGLARSVLFALIDLAQQRGDLEKQRFWEKKIQTTM